MNQTLPLTNIPQELKLILELLRNQHDDQSEESWVNYTRSIDWNHFFKLAMHHRVYPLLHVKLNENKKLKIPKAVSEKLKAQYEHNTIKMLYLSGEMEAVSTLFLGENIPTLFLKGPVIAEHLYQNLSLRTSSDLDFLISIEHLQKAEELLVSLGYEKDDYIQTVLGDWKWRHHHVTYFHPIKRIKLEIHWRLNPGPSSEPQFKELWSRKRLSTVTSSPVYFLGQEDLTVFLISHGARHGWSRLRWLADIHQILNQDIEWKLVYNLFKKHSNYHVGGQALLLVKACFQSPIPEGAHKFFITKKAKRLAQGAFYYLEQMINLHTEPLAEDISAYHSRHLFSLMSTQQKAWFLLSFLYPYPEDAETLPLPSYLHFFYFPLRPVLWAWRKTRKQVFS